jgi:hypothetical protein
MVLVSWSLLYIFSAFKYPPHIPRTRKHSVLLPTTMNPEICQVKINKQLQIWNVCSLYHCQNSSSYGEKWRSVLTVVLQQQISRWFQQALRTVGVYTFSASEALGSEMVHQLWHRVWTGEYSKNNERELHSCKCLITIENIVYYSKLYLTSRQTT